MSASAPAEGWFVATGGAQQGPLSLADARAVVGAVPAALSSETLVWHPQVTSSWCPPSSVPGFGSEGESAAAGGAAAAGAAAVGGAAVGGAAVSACPAAAGQPSGAGWYFVPDAPSGAAGGTAGSVGPVGLGALAAASEAGTVSATTLVWQEGLPGWQPLAMTGNLQADLTAELDKRDADRKAAAAEAAAQRKQPQGQAQGATNGAAPATASASAAAPGARPTAPDRKRSASAPAGGNPWVFVRGLPPDVTAAEISAHFRRVGAVRVDPGNGRPMIKLYRKKCPGSAGSGELNGDASICFANEASVPLALDVLDGLPLRDPVRQSRGGGQTVEPSAAPAAAGSAAGAAVPGSTNGGAHGVVDGARAAPAGAAAGWPLRVTQAEFRDKSGSVVKGRTAGAVAAGAARAPKRGRGETAAGSGSGADGGAGAGDDADVPFDQLPRKRRAAAAANATLAARASWSDAGAGLRGAAEPSHGIQSVLLFGVCSEEEHARGAALTGSARAEADAALAMAVRALLKPFGAVEGVAASAQFEAQPSRTGARGVLFGVARARLATAAAAEACVRSFQPDGCAPDGDPVAVFDDGSLRVGSASAHAK